MDNKEIEQRPKITFPCRYPIKVVGLGAPDFKDFVVRSIEQYVNENDIIEISVKDSRNSNYLSVTIVLNAQSEQQLTDIFQSLKASGRVKMVL